MFDDKETNPIIEQEIKEEQRKKFCKRLMIGGIVFIMVVAGYLYFNAPNLFGDLNDNKQTQEQNAVTGFVELENIPTETLENEIDRLYKLAYEQASLGTSSGDRLSSTASGLANTYQLEIMRRALGIQENGK